MKSGSTYSNWPDARRSRTTQAVASARSPATSAGCMSAGHSAWSALMRKSPGLPSAPRNCVGLAPSAPIWMTIWPCRDSATSPPMPYLVIVSSITELASICALIVSRTTGARRASLRISAFSSTGSALNSSRVSPFRRRSCSGCSATILSISAPACAISRSDFATAFGSSLIFGSICSGITTSSIGAREMADSEALSEGAGAASRPSPAPPGASS